MDVCDSFVLLGRGCGDGRADGRRWGGDGDLVSGDAKQHSRSSSSLPSCSHEIRPEWELAASTHLEEL
ncbi:hypothetical protein E2562_010566 [Oryza meyeriana var. granulata]|uniref:Uncharacterized protein n=1 Tax=Oryza meyeriana var. granulata TaxID=110450 RepID=A0A6G1BUR4_9ORYZ|nr:hypothetical protein E2562_010566 [Oryza meyeriana var. granulata]